MTISDVRLETEDIDWFAIDLQGHIAHFASGGFGFVPPSIADHGEDINLVMSYFRDSASSQSSVAISSHLSDYIGLNSHADRLNYLRSFTQMAEKGVYSFDCIMASIKPADYFLVVAPDLPLLADSLPDNIKHIISRTVYAGQFVDAQIIRSSKMS